MKNLKINEKKEAFYKSEINGNYKFERLNKITQSGVKYLLSSAYYDDVFLFDDLPDDKALPNPIEDIIYKHLYKKIVEIRKNREASIKEHDAYYEKLMEEYK